MRIVNRKGETDDLRKRGGKGLLDNACREREEYVQTSGGLAFGEGRSATAPREANLRGQIEAVVQKGEREFLERQEAQNEEGEPVEAEGAKCIRQLTRKRKNRRDQGNTRDCQVARNPYTRSVILSLQESPISMLLLFYHLCSVIWVQVEKQQQAGFN